MKTITTSFAFIAYPKLLLCICAFLTLGISSTLLAQDDCENQIIISNITDTSLQVDWDLTSPPVYELDLFINNTLYNTYLSTDTTLLINFPEGTIVSGDYLTACVISTAHHSSTPICVRAVYDPIATVEIVYRPQKPDFEPQCNRQVPQTVKYVFYVESSSSVINTNTNLTLNNYYLSGELHHRETFCTCFSHDIADNNCLANIPLEDKKWKACGDCPPSGSHIVPTYCPIPVSPLDGHPKTSKIQAYQNSPNPFVDYTDISYSLMHDEKISLHIYNISGDKVATLIDQEIATMGIYQTRFAAHQLPKGIYYAVLISPTGQKILKMLKL